MDQQCACSLPGCGNAIHTIATYRSFFNCVSSVRDLSIFCKVTSMSVCAWNLNRGKKGVDVVKNQEGAVTAFRHRTTGYALLVYMNLFFLKRRIEKQLYLFESGHAQLFHVAFWQRHLPSSWRLGLAWRGQPFAPSLRRL